MKNILAYIGVDQTVFYTLAARGWSLTSGIITLGMVAHFMSPDQQGYYYTFAGMLQMQILFELGMNNLVMQFASHEMAHLAWNGAGGVDGNAAAKSRLRSLAILTFKWYAVVAACVVLVVLPVGWMVLSTGANPSKISWQYSWASLIIATACNIFLTPILTMLEGCSRILEVARLRMYQNVLSSSLVWLVLITGGGIVALPVMSFGLVITTLLWLGITKKAFLRDLLWHTKSTEIIHWKTEIWPFQWKLALSCLSGYFVLQLSPPLLFLYRGAVEAGQMGMSLSITNALMSIAIVWMNAKAPAFGTLVAKRDYRSLDRIFGFTLSRTLTLMIVLGLLLCAANYFLHSEMNRYASRVLDPLSFTLLVVATTFGFVSYAQSTYLRAHKDEPFVLINLISAVLICIYTFLFGEKYGVFGVVAVYLLVSGLIGGGWGSTVFWLKRREWKSNSRS